MKMIGRGQGHVFEVKRLLHRSGLISGVLAAAMLVAETGGAFNESTGCQPLTMRYDAAHGGQIILATCWSAAPVVGPVSVRYQLDLHVMIGTRTAEDAAGRVR